MGARIVVEALLAYSPAFVQQVAKRPFGTQDLAEFSARLDTLVEESGPPLTPGNYQAYTDGACLRNPEGPGGWGALVSPLDAAEPEWELWGHLTSTSNNRAEALAILAAIEWVPPGSRLRLYSDSEYALNVLTGRYKAKANRDLWEEIRKVVTFKRLTLEDVWVRGHVGNEGNERADRLAVLGAYRGDRTKVQGLRNGDPAGGQGRPRERAAPREQAVPPELTGVQPRGAWETQFVGSVARQLRAGKALSEKQAAVLAKIRARAEG